MPYRLDLSSPPETAFDTLVDLGALDVEPSADGLAALLPDTISVETVANALGTSELRVSMAIGRDDDSVWTLAPRIVRTRRLEIVPAGLPPVPGGLILVDGGAFGTGLHATTSLCLDVIEDLLATSLPGRLLDVGTGSGILALAALRLGVSRAVAIDPDSGALRVAAKNARLNGLADRLSVVCGDVAAVRGSWPLVVANIRAAELIEMARYLAPRLETRGRLVLSGITCSVVPDVHEAYVRLGMRSIAAKERDGWTALVFAPTW